MAGILYHLPARIIMEMLVVDGHGVDPDDYDDAHALKSLWPIFVDEFPNQPDNAIRVGSTTGSVQGHTQTDGEQQGDEGIQLMFRGNNPEATWRKANVVSDYLDRVLMKSVHVPELGTGTGSDTTTYLVAAVTRTTRVISLGFDVPQGKRRLFSTNALCSIRQCNC